MKVDIWSTPMDVRRRVKKVWGSFTMCRPSNGGVLLCCFSAGFSIAMLGGVRLGKIFLLSLVAPFLLPLMTFAFSTDYMMSFPCHRAIL